MKIFGTRRSGPGKVFVRSLGLAACCALAACSSSAGGEKSQPAASAQSAGPVRLAVVTGKGVMLWSSKAGLRRVGPLWSGAGGVEVNQLSWSPDGRYLAWVQESPTAGNELVSFDTRAGTWATWQDEQGTGAISFSGSRPLSISGTFMYDFESGGGTAPVALSALPALSAPYNGGFMFTGDPASQNDPVAVWRATTNGTTTQVSSLPATGNLSEYATIAASANGEWVALERGDHQDVCGLGPSSRLILVSAGTGAVTSPVLPVPANTVWRFGNMTYGTGSVLDFSGYEVKPCDTKILFTTRLFELADGKIRVVGNNVIDGQRGPNGQLAVITGQDTIIVVNHDFPEVAIDGKQQLEINGKVVATPSPPTLVSWAPSNP